MAESKDILSTALGTLGIGGNIASTLLSNEANKSLIRERNQMAIDQWKRENEYNLPKNQVERLLAAGLNPALMYENGASGLVSAISPDMQAAQVQAPQVDPLTMAQINKINAETANIEKNTDLQGSELEVNKQKVLNMRQDIRRSEQDINESVARINNLDENTKRQEAERLNIKFEQVMRGKEWRDSHNKINAEIRRLNAGSSLDERQFKELTQTFIYRLTGLKLSNSLTEKEIQHYSVLMDKLGVEINQGKQSLVVNMPAYYQGKEVWRMHRGSSFVDKGASTLYDGIGSFLTLVKGFLSF